MGLHLVWGLTGARPRMLNILHMLSNMCVFAYIVYYINTFIYILILHTGLHTGLHPVNPAYTKKVISYIRAPRKVAYTGLCPVWGFTGACPRDTFHGPTCVLVVQNRYVHIFKKNRTSHLNNFKTCPKCLPTLHIITKSFSHI